MQSNVHCDLKWETLWTRLEERNANYLQVHIIPDRVQLLRVKHVFRKNTQVQDKTMSFRGQIFGVWSENVVCVGEVDSFLTASVMKPCGWMGLRNIQTDSKRLSACSIHSRVYQKNMYSCGNVFHARQSISLDPV